MRFDESISPARPRSMPRQWRRRSNAACGRGLGRSEVLGPFVSDTRGRGLVGTTNGAGGIGGVLARRHQLSGGDWLQHTFYYATGNGNIGALVNPSGVLQASRRCDPSGRHRDLARRAAGLSRFVIITPTEYRELL